jgi:hypothetical protein
MSDAYLNGVLSLIERLAISDRHAVHRSLRVHDGRKNRLDRGQYCERPVRWRLALDGPVDDPHHGQDRDDGQYSRFGTPEAAVSSCTPGTSGQRTKQVRHRLRTCEARIAPREKNP